jgi:hypothetical protein
MRIVGAPCAGGLGTGNQCTWICAPSTDVITRSDATPGTGAAVTGPPAGGRHVALATGTAPGAEVDDGRLEVGLDVFDELEHAANTVINAAVAATRRRGLRTPDDRVAIRPSDHTPSGDGISR